MTSRSLFDRSKSPTRPWEPRQGSKQYATSGQHPFRLVWLREWADRSPNWDVQRPFYSRAWVVLVTVLSFVAGVSTGVIL